MRKMVMLAAAIVLLAQAAPSRAAVQNPHRLTVEERWFDFQQLINQIKSEYGPLHYKKEVLGIDVDVLAERYWPEMSAAQTNGEFYALITRFVAEFRDGHFRSSIPTELEAYLPFGVTLVEGKVLIEWVKRDELPKEKFPFERGDELVAMDERPVEEVIDELLPYVQMASPRLARCEASQWLTYRPGNKLAVPYGGVSVTVRSLDGKITQTSELEWLHRGVPFDEDVVSASGANGIMMHSEDRLPKWLASSFKENETRDPFDHSIFDIVREHALYAERLYDCNGRTRIAIPEDATILIEEPFTVYYYPTAKGNIGYLRIAHYDPEDDKVAPNDWFEYYVWALTNMEQNTVGLIIDQDHNCGGDLILLEEIASLFMDEAFEPLKFELRASKRQILDMKRRIDNFKRPYHLYRDALLETYNLLLDSFEKGEYLTPKIGRRGSKKITPRNIYTKPVIILIDYFAASGGDMFPALLQGLGRAKLLGTATAGLGGSVVGMTPLFYSQIRTDMTQSLFYRPDGVAVENNGVDPDIPYEITVNDFVNGYRDYQKFYTDELLKLVQ